MTLATHELYSDRPRRYEVSHLGYRPEIDGLRALSVLAVLLFHADLGCPGGYVGVDVFFVLSGYLITRLLLKDLDAATFSFVHFWERRVRRILPASLFMTTCVLIVGYLLLIPTEMTDLAKSAVSHVLFSSNLYFWRLDWLGYFGAKADHQPLLHTWSLSIEEQFYLVFPLLLLLLRRSRRRTVTVLQALWGISFVIGVWGLTVGDQQVATFYLLPTRGWELLTGALIATRSWRATPFPRFVAECGSFLGLVGILAPVFLYDRMTLFPVWAALPPCLGCAAVVVLSDRRMTFISRALTYKPLVSIGLISYSLYLWHWPIISFHRILFGSNSPLAVRLALVGASFIAGWLSWRFIETPYRERRLGARRTMLFVQVSIATGLLLMISLGVWRSNGFSDRVPASLLKDIRRSDKYVAKPVGDGFDYPRLGKGHDSRVDFVVWGDSHGIALAEAIDEAAKLRDLHGRAILYSGIPPLRAFSRNEAFRSKWTAAALRYVLERRVAHVLLIARWRYLQSEEPTAADIDEDPSRKYQRVFLFNTLTKRSTDVAESRDLVLHVFDQMLTELENNGTKVWILRQVPEQNETRLAIRWMRKKIIPVSSLVPFDPKPVDRGSHLLAQTNANRFLDEIARRHPRIVLLDPTPTFFANSATLPIIVNDRCLYWDDDHLSYSGSQWLLNNMGNGIVTMLDDISRDLISRVGMKGGDNTTN